MSQLSKISTTIVTKALIVGIFLITCFYDSAANSGEEYISGQLFVKVNNNSSESLLYPSPDDTYPNGLEELLKKFRITDISKACIIDDPKLSRTYLIRFNKNKRVQELINGFSRLDYIEYAEKVPLYKTSLTPNDLHPNQWHLPQILAEAAWDITTGSASVVIAIVDDAVLLSHEDLAPVIWVNPGEIPGNGIDDEPNGYIDDINGWDAADNDNDPNPVNPTNSYFTHGTHCAGIAAAATDNGIGIASVSYNVKVMAVKTATNGWGTVPAAFQGVVYAIAANANIISMSWGGGPYSQTFQNLFDLAHAQGIVLIAAAGNDNTDILSYPASYNHVISVGATNSSDQRAWFSNYGDSIDVMAPGQAIWSCKAGSNSSYDYNSGTSMACPLVSSLAALMLSWDPTLTPDELEACLKSSCDNIDAQNPGYIGQIGAGRINAEQALLCLKPINADFTSDFVQVCPGDTVQFTDLSSNNPTSWQWVFPGGFPASSTLQNPDIVYNTAGTYDVTLIATNTDGTDTIIKLNYITVAVPTAIISGSTTIIAGFSTNLKVELTGNPNWSITYSDGTTNFTINNITNTPYYITVTPSDTTTYTLVSVTDNGCAGTVSGSAVVNVINISNTICLTLQPDSIQGKDAEVFSKSGSENTNYGNARFSRAWSWTFSSIPGDLRSFIEFDLSSIPQSATIINATLTLIHDSTSVSPFGHSTLSGSNASYLRRVISPWAENTITWNNQPANTTTNQVILPQSDSIDQDYVIDATMLVQDMVNDPSNSHGFSLELVTEQYYRSMTFSSSDSPDAFRWPKLEICYIALSTDTCTTTFQKILGGSAGDAGSSVIQTTDGGYIFTGGTVSFGAGNYDVYLVKTDVNGDTMWTRSYGGTGTEIGHDIQQTADGGYIIAGESIGLGAANADFYLIRTDINGNLLWSKTYGGADYERCYAVDQTTDGGFILTGRTNSFGAGQDDLYLVKTDINGDTLWTKTYGGSNDDVGRSVRQTSDGGYIITGFTRSYDAGNGDVYLIKTDSSGNVSWTKVIGGAFMEDGWSVQQTFDGGYIITGFTVTYGAGSYDVYLIKTDTNGNILWSKTYGGTSNDVGYSVQQTDDGGYIITGKTASFGAGGFGWDVYLIKTDSTGDTLWTRTFGGTNDDKGHSVQQTGDGGYIIAGQSQSFISGNIDMYLIKTDADGNNGCNQFSTNTTVSSTSPSISSGFIINNPATIVNNAATIVNSTASDDSVLCSVPCNINDPTPCYVQTDFNADTVCIGDSTSFTDLSTDSINNIIIWRWYFGDGDSIIGVQNPTHLYASADTFSVILIIGNDTAPACFDTVVKQVVVLDTLFIKAPPDASICIGDSIQLSPLIMICGAAPYTYSWTPTGSLSDPTIANPNAGPLVNTTYYITVTDSGGMISTDSVTITIDTNCCISWAEIGSDTNYCAGDTVYFSNNSISNGVAAYVWDFGPSAIPTSFIGATSPPVYFNTSGAFQVMLILTDSCGIDTSYHTVNIFPAPIADAGADTTLCRFDTVQIGSIPISGHSYTWSPTIGLSDSVIADPYAYADSSLTYVVIITSTVSGCSNADSVTITRYPATQADAGIDTSHCLGDSLQLNVTSGLIYSWTPSTGLSDDSIADPWVIVSDTTTYIVTVRDSNSCIGIDSVTIRVNPLPIVSVTADVTIYYGESVQLNGSGGPTYSWLPTSGLNCSNCENPIANPLETTTYYLTVTDSLGCSITDTVVVTVNLTKVIFIPNIFSPNGDGENDFFYVQGLGIAELNMLIFDRWGEMVFENTGFIADDRSAGWDGTYKGKAMNPAVFVFVVTGTFIDGSEINEKGDLTLVK